MRRWKFLVTCDDGSQRLQHVEVQAEVQAVLINAECSEADQETRIVIQSKCPRV